MKQNLIKETFLPLYPLFYNIAFRQLGNKEDASDAVQELFVKLCTSENKLYEIENPQGYGVQMIKNLCLDKIKSKKESILKKSTELIDKNLTNTQSDSDIIRKENEQRLRLCINRLPNKQKEIFILKVIKEMDMKNIERLTGLSQVNIRVTLSRAKKQVFNDFNRYKDEK